MIKNCGECRYWQKQCVPGDFLLSGSLPGGRCNKWDGPGQLFTWVKDACPQFAKAVAQDAQKEGLSR